MSKKEKEKQEDPHYIQTLTTQHYSIFFKGSLYEFYFNPHRTIDENIEALEYLLKHAKNTRDVVEIEEQLSKQEEDVID